MLVFSWEVKQEKSIDDVLLSSATGLNTRRVPSAGTFQTSCPGTAEVKTTRCSAQPQVCALGWQCNHELKCFWSKTWSFLRNLSHRNNACSLVWKSKTSHRWRMTMLLLNRGAFSSLRTRTEVMLLLLNSSHRVKLLLDFVFLAHLSFLLSPSAKLFQSSCNNVITLLNENLDSFSNIVPLATSVTAFILMER